MGQPSLACSRVVRGRGFGQMLFDGNLLFSNNASELAGVHRRQARGRLRAQSTTAATIGTW